MNTRKYIIAFGLLFNLLVVTNLQAQQKPKPAPLSDYSLSFCRKQNWAKACLNTLLTYRCSQYYLPYSPSKSRKCSASAASMINFLDYKTVQIINDNKIYRFKIIFTSKLIKLINTSIVQTYLSDLAVDLRAAMDSHSPFDLYQYTFKYAKDRDTTVLWLGILFQDTTFSRVQVQYLEDLDANGKLSKKEADVKELMKEIAIMLEPKNLLKEDFRSWLRLYPSFKINDINEIVNPSFYHFYPVALWAIHLRKMEWSKEYSTLIPFALNADYEFQSLDPDRWPWRHPDTFEINSKTTYKLRDIYVGLAASLFGANKDKLLPAFKGFKTSFSANPFKFMKSWALREK